MTPSHLFLTWAAFATIVVGGASCQRILGIHGGGAGKDAGPADANVNVDGVTGKDLSPANDAETDDGSRKDVVADAPPTHDGPDGAADASADAAEDERSDPRPRDAEMDAVTDANASPDKANSDGSAGDRGAVDSGAGDVAACAPAWHGENAEARLLMPGSAATACSIAAADVPALAAAVDATLFRGAQACGACLLVQGSLSTRSVVVPVVERSSATGLLLTRAAMDQIAPGGSLISVDWQLVPCDTRDQPLRYYIKEGSNAGYVGVQVRNARYPIASVSAVGARTSVALTLQPYNYWESTAVGAGPLTLRVVDINGQVVEDSGIKVVPQTESVGQGQFPLCR